MAPKKNIKKKVVKKKAVKKASAKKVVKKKAVKKSSTKKVVKKKAVKKSSTKKVVKKKAVKKSSAKKAVKKTNKKQVQKSEDVSEMLERLETFRPLSSKKRKSVRPLSATVTMLSLIGILISIFMVVPKSISWGLGLIALFIILLIASIYSLTLN